MMGDLLSYWFKEEARKIYVFLTRKNTKNPRIKLTFPTICEKFNFEFHSSYPIMKPSTVPIPFTLSGKEFQFVPDIQLGFQGLLSDRM